MWHMSETTHSSNIERNKEVVRNFVESAFKRHEIEAIDKFFALNLIQHNPQLPQGREHSKQYFRTFFEEFPDLTTTIEHIVAESDKVMAILTTKATNKQTGKRFILKSADLFRIENYMIAEHWDVVDTSGIA